MEKINLHTDPLPSSPCIQVCQVDDEGVCIGCLRTVDEIARWPRMDSEAQRRLLQELERRRAATAA